MSDTDDMDEIDELFRFEVKWRPSQTSPTQPNPTGQVGHKEYGVPYNTRGAGGTRTHIITHGGGRGGWSAYLHDTTRHDTNAKSEHENTTPLTGLPKSLPPYAVEPLLLSIVEHLLLSAIDPSTSPKDNPRLNVRPLRPLRLLEVL